MPDNILTDAPTLTFIDLRQNCISGLISPSIVRFINYMRESVYRYIDLRGNEVIYLDITNEEFLEIPIEDLTCLRLSQCSLVGELGLVEEYWTLTNLLYIDLSWNHLTNTLPLNWITKCNQNLVVLNLSHNCFIGSISDDIQVLTDLEELNLSSNNLTGRIPSTMISLQSLRILDLHSNNLTGDLPGLDTIIGLEIVDILFNNFLGNYNEISI